MPKFLFSSYHNCFDPYSGAAVSTRALLRAAARNGWRTRAFCGPLCDSPETNDQTIVELVKRIDPNYSVRSASFAFQGRKTIFRYLRFNDEGVDAAIYLPDGAFRQVPRSFLPRNLGDAFLSLFASNLREFQPEIYGTYGGYWAAPGAAKLARDSGAKNVFFLHNLQYERRELFDNFDAAIVPSQFAADYYRERLDLRAIVVPPTIETSNVVALKRNPKYVVFINPSPEKGLALFAALARKLAVMRPDVKLLVVGGRTPVENSAALRSTLELPNVSFSRGSSDPRAVYDVARILLVPSLCRETFGRAVVEASLNEIPVLCSDRGALTEVLGDDPRIKALALPVFDGDSADATTRERVVARWLDALLQIWDDADLARELGDRLAQNARRFAGEDATSRTLDALARLATKTPSL